MGSMRGVRSVSSQCVIHEQNAHQQNHRSYCDNFTSWNRPLFFIQKIADLLL